MGKADIALVSPEEIDGFYAELRAMRVKLPDNLWETGFEEMRQAITQIREYQERIVDMTLTIQPVITFLRGLIAKLKAQLKAVIADRMTDSEPIRGCPATERRALIEAELLDKDTKFKMLPIWQDRLVALNGLKEQTQLVYMDLKNTRRDLKSLENLSGVGNLYPPGGSSTPSLPQTPVADPPGITTWVPGLKNKGDSSGKAEDTEVADKET